MPSATVQPLSILETSKMSQLAEHSSSTSGIEAPILYLVDTGETPVFDQSRTAADQMTMVGAREKKVMPISNGRPLSNNFSLDVEGFAFAAHPTKVVDFFDDAELASVYTPEVEKLVAKYTGASKAVVFDHTRRSSAAATRDKHNARDPVSAAHVDYTDQSAVQRLKDVLGDKAAERLNKRFVIVNVWRSMRGVIQEWPLAVCDARSINDDCLQTVVRNAPHRTEPSFEYSRSSETRHAVYDPNNRWFYFPNMDRDEALLFKSYETLRDGTARYSMHTALEDPTRPPNASPRESIESRVFAFFD